MEDLRDVVERVRGELGQLLEVLDAEGGRYADRYAEWFMQSGGGRYGGGPPQAPPALRGKFGEGIRELVRDEAIARRLYGRTS